MFIGQLEFLFCKLPVQIVCPFSYFIIISLLICKCSFILSTAPLFYTSQLSACSMSCLLTHVCCHSKVFNFEIIKWLIFPSSVFIGMWLMIFFSFVYCFFFPQLSIGVPLFLLICKFLRTKHSKTFIDTAYGGMLRKFFPTPRLYKYSLLLIFQLSCI